MTSRNTTNWSGNPDRKWSGDGRPRSLRFQRVTATTVRDYGAVALALFLIGTSAAVAVPIADYPVFGGQALRYVVAAAILFLATRWTLPRRVRPAGREWLLLLGLAAFGIAGFNVFLVLATRYADPAMVGTVIAATPIALAVSGPAFQGRRPQPKIVVGATVVAIGAAVASGFGDNSFAGSMLAVCALSCEVAFSLLAVPLIPRLGAVRVSAYAAALAVPLLVVAGLLVSGGALFRLPTASEFWSLLYLAVVVACAANILWYQALPRVGADRAGLFYGATPIGAFTTAILLGTGDPTPADLLGGALVIAGLVVGLSSRTRRQVSRVADSTRSTR